MKGTWITHLKMQKGLWLEDQRNPPCVAADRVVLAPGPMQLNIFAWNKELTKYVKDGQPKGDPVFPTNATRKNESQ
jgi:hypothetical protein